MTSPRLVADAGPLIALAATGRLDLLRQVSVVVAIPEAVAEELCLGSGLPGATRLAAAVGPQGWIRVLTAPPPRQDWAPGLGAGEAEAILLADALNLPLLADDLRARRAAAARTLACIGTGRVLIEARRRGHLDRVAPVLDELESVGYRLSAPLRTRILELADEG